MYITGETHPRIYHEVLSGLAIEHPEKIQVPECVHEFLVHVEDKLAQGRHYGEDIAVPFTVSQIRQTLVQKTDKRLT